MAYAGFHLNLPDVNGSFDVCLPASFFAALEDADKLVIADPGDWDVSTEHACAKIIKDHPQYGDEKLILLCSAAVVAFVEDWLPRLRGNLTGTGG